MFHIIVENKYKYQDKRGKISNYEELLDVLKPSEIKSMFEHDASNAFKDIFITCNIKPQFESFLFDAAGIKINCISNGYEITTLVFYF